MQGLFMNKPVVATNSGSTKDLLFDNNFKLVNTNNTGALIDGVSFYLDNKICKDTRKEMLNFFSKNIMVEKILYVYKLILL
jgi:glycosyltransferase involved in cell wall biosynthesis